MKKLVLLLLVALLALTSCSAAGGNKTYKVGSYSVTPNGKIDNEKGSAQINTTIATVVLDADGKIVNVNIDTAQNSVKAEGGKITVPAETPSKKVKKDAYGMKEKSAIGKEWYEQIEALEKALVGKTIDDVKGLEIKDELFTDEDLLASVSIKVTGYIDAVVKAMENAVEVKGDVAKVGAVNITKISDKPGDAGGQVTFNTNYGHVVLDKDGKVLQAFVDVAQNRVDYDKDGKFAEHTAKESKKVLKDEYGMKAKSGLGKEWFEQAQALEEFMVGKTVEEITGVETDDAGVPQIDDLKSSVTIKINDYKEIIQKAAENAIEIK